MSAQSNITFGPIAPENNPPINPQYYVPRVFTITQITSGSTTTITTSLPNNYVVGQLIRLLIPSTYGASQLNNRTAFVLSIPMPNQVIIDLDSNRTDPFIPSPAFGPTPPIIIAVGDNNSGAINDTGRLSSTFIPGSFINVSPV